MVSPDQTHNPSLMAKTFLEAVLICTIAPCVPHCPKLWVSLQIYHINDLYIIPYIGQSPSWTVEYNIR